MDDSQLLLRLQIRAEHKQRLFHACRKDRVLMLSVVDDYINHLKAPELLMIGELLDEWEAQNK